MSNRPSCERPLQHPPRLPAGDAVATGPIESDANAAPLFATVELIENSHAAPFLALATCHEYPFRVGDLLPKRKAEYLLERRMHTSAIKKKVLVKAERSAGSFMKLSRRNWLGIGTLLTGLTSVALGALALDGFGSAPAGDLVVSFNAGTTALLALASLLVVALAFRTRVGAIRPGTRVRMPWSDTKSARSASIVP